MKVQHYLAIIVASFLIAQVRFGGAIAQTSPTSGQGAATEPSKPLDLTQWPVRYGMGQHDSRTIYPGYVSPDHKCFYQWRGVALDIASFPNLGSDQRTKIFDIYAPPGIQVVYCDPPIRIVKYKNGSTALAFYDHTNGILLQWKSISVSIGAGAAVGRENLDDLVVDETRYNVVEIDYPQTSLK